MSLILEKLEIPAEPMTFSEKVSRTVILTENQVLDMLAGYQMADHAIVDFKEKAGKCLLCGKPTNSAARCICYDCHKQHMKPIYEQAKREFLHGKNKMEYKY